MARYELCAQIGDVELEPLRFETEQVGEFVKILNLGIYPPSIKVWVEDDVFDRKSDVTSDLKNCPVCHAFLPLRGGECTVCVGNRDAFNGIARRLQGLKDDPVPCDWAASLETGRYVPDCKPDVIAEKQ